MTSEEFSSIEILFIENSNPEKIGRMTAYTKDQFNYLGISAPERKKILREIFRGYKWERAEVLSFVAYCWKSKYRELHYAGLDILIKQANVIKVADIPFLENLVTSHSWWDTVDGLAVHPIGKALCKDQKAQKKWTIEWAESNDLWLRRVAIIYQLKYKSSVNIELMEYAIERANGTKEFFLNKAIGWMLREYSKTDPEYVKLFCRRTKLSNLSRKEALRLL
jgi:3-methyladenine DNA glycosylase AlkD